MIFPRKIQKKWFFSENIKIYFFSKIQKKMKIKKMIFSKIKKSIFQQKNDFFQKIKKLFLLKKKLDRWLSIH